MIKQEISCAKRVFQQGDDLSGTVIVTAIVTGIGMDVDTMDTVDTGARSSPGASDISRW